MSVGAVGAESRAPSRLSFVPGLQVPGFIAALALVTLALYFFALPGLHAPAAPIHAPWVAFVLLFFLTEAFPVHVHFRSEAHSLSLSELAIVLGLYLVAPDRLLLAQLLGAAVALVAVRRQRPVKLGFNLAAFSFGTCIAILVFHAFLRLGDAYSAAGWAGALLGATANAVVGVLLVSVVIWLAAARSTLRELPRLLLVAIAGSLATASLAVAAVELARYDANSLWVLVVPVGGTALAFRAYTTQLRRHEHLEFLYRSMRAMQGATEFRTSVRELLVAARTMLSADVAEIVLFPRSPGEGGLVSRIGRDGETLLESTRVSETSLRALEYLSGHETAVLLAENRKPHALDDYLTERGVRDGIAGVLRGAERIVGVVLVADRSGDVATFTVDDRKLFDTFASHAAVLLENDRVKEQLRYQAFHDGLTSLPNRVLFGQEVHEALARTRHAAARPVVLFVDLDDFKLINDSLGHGAGDQVLVAVAERLRAALRPGDLAARFGGDEFAVLLERSERDAAEAVAERIVDALRAPFALEGREVRVHASIGLADAGPTDESEDVLRNADVAMYSAKTSGKGRYSWYEPEMQVRARRRQELASALEVAIERDEMDAHFQPIVDLASGRTVAFEALARWQSDEHGLLYPDSFIPVAEETGAMVPIGRAVLRRACEQLSRWHARGASELMVTVNLSQSELVHPNLVDDVRAILTETRIPASALVLEITESSAMHDPPATIETLTALRGLGVRLALDDFGTGYSSLSHLRQFPIDMLKIAKPFVDRIDTDAADASFVDAILRLAVALRLDVVAEGIERLEQARALTAMRCGLAQGYLYARALPASEIRLPGVEDARPRHLRVA